MLKGINGKNILFNAHSNCGARMEIDKSLYIFCLTILTAVITMGLLTNPAYSADNQPIMFVGDANYPPMTYQEGEVPKGVIIDIVHALEQKMGRPITIRLMEWNEAQKLVSQGKADALCQMSITDGRKQVYDFSDPLVELNFSIFSRTGRVGITTLSDLRGMQVGVTAGGVPRKLVEADSLILINLINDYRQGFQMLKSRKLDAVVADSWAGNYVLAEQGITDIKTIGNPVAQLKSAIAVRKGNETLLVAINDGLRSLNAAGTIAQIKEKWTPKEVIVQTREQAHRKNYLVMIGFLALLLTGAAAWLFSMRREIALRKQAEENITKSKNLLQAIINTAPISIFWKDRNLRYLGCNNSFAKDAGVECPNDLIGKDDYQIVWKDHAELYRADDLRVIESGIPKLSYDEPQTATDGNLKWLRTSKVPLRNEINEIVGVLGMYEDITKFKQSEKILIEQAELLDITHDSIIVRTMNNVITFWNKGSETQYGWKSEEVHEKANTHDLLQTIFPESLDIINNTLQRTNFWEGELTHTRKDGAQIIVASRWVLKRDGNGAPIAIMEINNDITERKNAEKEKQAIERQLIFAQKMESLGVLSSGIAHDFNNILTVIFGRCSMALKNYEKAGDYIPAIENAAYRAAELCRQMLAYAGKVQLAEAQIDFVTLVDETVKMLKSSLPKNTEVKLEILPSIPLLKGDAGQLGQIVMNLIINASEAIGKEQGEIRVLLSKTVIKDSQSDRDYHGKSIPPGNYIALEVTDNGCGMDEKTKSRIFEPFYTTKFSGRGLGMAAVLGIISAHGGIIQLFSDIGKGTTFKVYFPAQTSEITRDESLEQTEQSELWQGSGTILLVEDEVEVIRVAKEMLEYLGYRVIEAANGKEGLELYLKNAAEITLVVTDLGMPVMDGYALFQELKQCNPTLPIIISSGFGEVDVSSRIARTDIAGLINKPYSFDQLREVLKNVDQQWADILSQR